MENLENKRDNMNCDKCKNERQEPHPCPYRMDIDDDYETLCVCCTSCENDCRDDI